MLKNKGFTEFLWKMAKNICKNYTMDSLYGIG
nr:MAG TPA: hypothetical protein [Caudoviricetes sp.]